MIVPNGAMSIERFERAMAEKGTNVITVDVVGDGACLFRATSVLQYGSEDNHGELREAVVESMVNK